MKKILRVTALLLCATIGISATISLTQKKQSIKEIIQAAVNDMPNNFQNLRVAELDTSFGGNEIYLSNIESEEPVQIMIVKRYGKYWSFKLEFPPIKSADEASKKYDDLKNVLKTITNGQLQTKIDGDKIHDFNADYLTTNCIATFFDQATYKTQSSAIILSINNDKAYSQDYKSSWRVYEVSIEVKP